MAAVMPEIAPRAPLPAPHDLPMGPVGALDYVPFETVHGVWVAAHDALLVTAVQQAALHDWLGE